MFVDNYRNEWLPHLRDSIPAEAKRNRTSLYTIALEGWRRGLKLKFYSKINEQHKRVFLYSLENEKRIHFFNESSGDGNTKEAFEICKDKSLTAEYLQSKNIPVPVGKKFIQESSLEDIVEFSKKLTYPLVVKPTDGSAGRGVIINLQNEKELIRAINFVRGKLQFNNIIVQEHVTGDEVRIYVLEDRVLAASNRVPANVVGDGQSTIVKLIEVKNIQRKLVPHLYHRPIRIDAELRGLIKDAGYSLDSVLEKGERVFLRKVSNISTGGDPIDVTESLTEEQKRIAIEATKAIPGLVQCGVDMIIDKKNGKEVILELNTRPGIGSHLFPIEGIARDIPKKIIDYYFPETKNNHTSGSNVYFDLQTVFDTLNNGYLSEVEIKEHPTNALFIKRLVIKGDLDTHRYYKLFKGLLLEKGFYGFIKKSNKNSIDIVLGHENIDEINAFKRYLQNRRKGLQIHSIKIRDWEKPIRNGFNLIDGLDQMSLVKLENKNREKYREMRTFEMEVNRLNKRIELMRNSRSWKISAPVRLLKDRFKRLN